MECATNKEHKEQSRQQTPNEAHTRRMQERMMQVSKCGEKEGKRGMQRESRRYQRSKKQKN